MRVQKGIQFRANAALGLWVLISLCGCNAQTSPQTGYDVLAYRYTLHLPDALDGTFPFEATLRLIAQDSMLTLNLQRSNLWRDGAVVHTVHVNGRDVRFAHSGRVLRIFVAGFNPDTLDVRITGETHIPKAWRIGGTFATDSWPDRTGWWLPVAPNPADIAMHHFVITAPKGVFVLASGRQVGQTPLHSGRISHLFAGQVPVSPAVVSVIASASMIHRIERYGSYWSEPADTARARSVHRVMEQGRSWMEQRLGPIPFDNVATVFSLTRFLGMEYAALPRVNLSAVSDDAPAREILIHEWVHQWIGAGRFPATPADLWVSEGFATYVTALFFLDVQGVPLPLGRWHQRASLHARAHPACLSEPYETYSEALSPHVYERAALAWHSLRELVGEDHFWSAAHTLAQGTGVISSEEVKRTFEAQSGVNLDVFWHTWVTAPTFPPSGEGTQGCS